MPEAGTNRDFREPQPLKTTDRPLTKAKQPKDSTSSKGQTSAAEPRIGSGVSTAEKRKLVGSRTREKKKRTAVHRCHMPTPPPFGSRLLSELVPNKYGPVMVSFSDSGSDFQKILSASTLEPI